MWNGIDRRVLYRVLMYVFGGVITLGSLLYSNYLAQQLEEKEQESVALYSEALELVGNNQGAEEAFTFIFDKLVKGFSTDIPKVQIGEDQKPTFSDFDYIQDWEPEQKAAFLEEKIQQFRQENKPIKIEFAEGRFNEVVYGDSNLLKQLKWFPWIQMFVAGIFIAIVFIAYSTAKRNEQNRVWVGLAKETAHQLGTPVSSLMAWIELLKFKTEERPSEQELVLEMERDIKRLEIIADRFSKIGSKPELIEVKLGHILDHSAEYLTKRMSRSGKVTFKLNNQIPLDNTLKINPQLFDWVIENLLKNALDAISKEGTITIDAGERGDQYFIDITDTGKGIPKSNHKKVFEPGYTTKKRGWGLGLSLTKRIVENYHSGRIFVKQSEIGKGTTFRVMLNKG